MSLAIESRRESTSSKRVALLPDVPTIAESGLAGFVDYQWLGIVAPAGTPQAIVARFNSEISRVLARSDVRDRIISLGAEVAGSTPEELSNFIETQVTRWKRVLKSEHRS